MAETTQVQKITKDMLIGEVVSKYPSVVETITNEGVHCAGCGAAQWETLEQGFSGHGKSQEEIDEIVSKLNRVAEESKEESKFNFSPENANVKITQEAANKLNEILKKEGKEDHGLRIAVKPGGCSGKSYELTFEVTKNDDDTVIEVHGAKFYFDNASLSELDGSEIDYVESLQGAGFKISNPNAKSTCGCGDSFS
jgi:iron-sulfur cluster assembly accessory protein